MYYLWIDPWIRKLWYAIIDNKKEIINAATVINELPSDTKTWLYKATRQDEFIRVFDMVDLFDKLTDKYQIKKVCIEKLFFTKYNKSNAEFVYSVRWGIIYILQKKNIDIIEYSPKEIKKLITWNGQASKETMQITTKKIFWLKELPKPHDVADALAMAYLAHNSKKASFIY